MARKLKFRLAAAGASALGLVLIWSVWAYTTRSVTSDVYEDGEVSCPFLAMAPPGSGDLWTFACGAESNGMNLAMALFVGAQVTYQQRGVAAVLRLEAPDLHRLREVPGISHDDRFALYLPELRERTDEIAVDGRITFQQLVELKR
ncbi:MAG: hypothetical protein ACI9MC_001757 [Kiritimatiellia bacterium]|jgi:hypothetical protein